MSVIIIPLKVEGLQFPLIICRFKSTKTILWLSINYEINYKVQNFSPWHFISVNWPECHAPEQQKIEQAIYSTISNCCYSNLSQI